MTDTRLSRDLPDIADDLPFFTDCRRRLHRRPEEGWTEFESTWTVVSALKAMGCEVVTGADLIEPEAVMGRDAAKVEAAQRRALEAGVPEAFLTSLDGWTGAAPRSTRGVPVPSPSFASKSTACASPSHSSSDACPLTSALRPSVPVSCIPAAMTCTRPPASRSPAG